MRVGRTQLLAYALLHAVGLGKRAFLQHTGAELSFPLQEVCEAPERHSVLAGMVLATPQAGPDWLCGWWDLMAER